MNENLTINYIASYHENGQKKFAILTKQESHETGEIFLSVRQKEFENRKQAQKWLKEREEIEHEKFRRKNRPT